VKWWIIDGSLKRFGMLANVCGYRVAIAVTKIRFRILVSRNPERGNDLPAFQI
jgi:hypothetical protein